MHARLACGVLLIAALTGRTPAAMSADTAAAAVAPRSAPAARAKNPAAQKPKTDTAVHLSSTPPVGAPGSVYKASMPKPPAAVFRSGKSAPASLGGPARYDAKKGAMLGGTVMPQRPRI